MSPRSLSLLVVSVFAGAALSGCFGSVANDNDLAPIDGSALPTFKKTLFLNQVMFHPYPGGMLSAWAFAETQGAGGFDIPVYRVTEGQKVEIQFVNTFEFNHTIHWHGLHVPWEMDGVPYLTQDPVLPGESFTYEFEAKPAGTHFFHCHVDTPHHTDMGMYGVLIVEPAGGERHEYDSEDLMVLDDWDSSHLHQNQNADATMTVDSATDDSGDPFNQLDRTSQQVRDTYNDPRYPVVRDVYQNPGRVQRDWYPETYAPWQPIYDTWTINGKSFPLTDPLSIKEGETKRIRMVNVGNTIFSMHIHGHHFLVTHKDGYPLDSPYRADTVPIAPGERYSVLLEGDNPGIWMLHDHMGLHEMNNHISPGGIMTMLAYEGFDVETQDGHQHEVSAKQIAGMRSGDFLGLYR